MGVPRFYRWLVDRYPNIVERISSKRLPSFDSLYLDMNGIIHQCTHPPDRDPLDVPSEEEMFTAIFASIDRLFEIANPKKLLFIAVDGVAPRAKMNQQRQRRFKAAKEMQDLLMQEQRRRGAGWASAAIFDSNCITPGTPFMARLSTAVKTYILNRIRDNEKWKSVTVIYSGHEVPGEGEHKIMDFIRRRKKEPTYNPAETHCLYGLDADLIMLGLVTHERHFALLREDITWRSQRRGSGNRSQSPPFLLLMMPRLRDNLDQDFWRPGLSFGYDLERIVDDFVFLCYFMGNDFLPHLPAADIPTGGLDKVMQIYEELLPTFGGYMTDNGYIDLKRLEKFCERLAVLERDEFVRRALERYVKGPSAIVAYTPIRISAPPGQITGLEPTSRPRSASAPPGQGREMRQPRQQGESSRSSSDYSPSTQGPSNGGTASPAATAPAASRKGPRGRSMSVPPSAFSRPASSAASSMNQTASQSTATAPAGASLGRSPARRAGSQPSSTDRQQVVIEDDHVWHQRYYAEKLGFGRGHGAKSSQQRRDLVRSYVEGLAWMLHYYYHGVASWNWFFPYHYAPLAAELKNISKFKMDFDPGEPFLPFQQLLSVLPAASSSQLPSPYQALMLEDASPIADFYDTSFAIDMVGKRNSWEGLALIPFIEESRLLTATKSIDPESLTPEERARNSFDREYVFRYGEDWNYFE